MTNKRKMKTHHIGKNEFEFIRKMNPAINRAYQYGYIDGVLQIRKDIYIRCDNCENYPYCHNRRTLKTGYSVEFCIDYKDVTSYAPEEINDNMQEKDMLF